MKLGEFLAALARIEFDPNLEVVVEEPCKLHWYPVGEVRRDRGGHGDEVVVIYAEQE